MVSLISRLCNLRDSATNMIIQILWLLNKRIYSRLLTSCVLSLSLAVTPAVAEYEPPADQRSPSGYTSTTGSRGGCEASEGTPLTLLAPQRHIGQTASTHPTFAWFIPDSRPFAMEFTLYEYGSDSRPKLAHKLELKSSPGIMKLSLPQNKPGLVRGQRYLWQVAILCDPNYPSSDLVAKAEIEVVEMPPSLNRTLFTKMADHEMADLYAKAGLWYDALSEALGPAEDSRLRKVASTLLEDIAKLEESKAIQVESRHSENLRQIARSERQQSSPRSQ